MFAAGADEKTEALPVKGDAWTYQSGAMRIETSVLSTASQTVCE